jgi:hypothetical protein
MSVVSEALLQYVSLGTLLPTTRRVNMGVTSQVWVTIIAGRACRRFSKRFIGASSEIDGCSMIVDQGLGREVG